MSHTPPSTAPTELTMEVLRQFRVIYGTMRHYFREVEERCALPGSHMWILQEAERSPASALRNWPNALAFISPPPACWLDKLVTDGYLERNARRTIGEG